MKKNILYSIILIITLFSVNLKVNAKVLTPNINALNIVEYRFNDDDSKDTTNAPGDNFSDINIYSNNATSCSIFIKGGSYNELYYMVQDAFTFIKILTPILVGILSLIDYIKAITSSNDDEIKKATSRTVKRLIIGLILFFLPFLLDFIFDVFGFTDISRCGIGT